MADYRVGAPEVTPPQINPAIGIYQDGFGTSIRHRGQSLGDMYSDRVTMSNTAAKARLELEANQAEAQAKAGFALNQIDITREDAMDSLISTLGFEPTDSEMNALLEGKKTTDRLRQADIQRPRAALSSLRRIADLRKQVVENPFIAEELMKMYKTNTGVAALKDLNDITAQTEDRRAAVMTDIDNESMKLGLDMSAPLEVRAQAVSGVRQRDEIYRRKEQEYQEYNRAKAVSKDQAIMDMRSTFVPALGDKVDALSQVVSQIPADATPEQRAEIVQSLQEQKRLIQQTAVNTFNHPDLKSSDYQDAIAVPMARIDELLKYASGEQQREDLARHNEVLQAVATNKLMQNPAVPQIQALMKFYDTIPTNMQNLMSQSTVFTRVNGMMNIIAGSEADQLDYLTTIAPIINDPKALGEMVRQNKAGLIDAANSDMVTDEQFNKAVSTWFGEFSPREFRMGNGKVGQLFHEQLPSLADPAVQGRLSKVSPQTKAELVNSLDNYLSYMTRSVSSELNRDMGFMNVDVEDQKTDPNGYPWPEGSIKKFSLFGRAEPYLDISYPDGMPVFRMKQDTPQDKRADITAAVSKLNKVAPKIKNIVDVYQTLGLYADMPKNELAKFLATSGVTPDYAAAQARANGTQPNYGARNDGTQKGTGYLGALKVPGGVATEYSMQSQAVTKDGKQVDFPTLVPTLTQEEIDLMVNDIIPNQKSPPEHIIQKAIAHAKMRLENGQSPFAN